MFPDLDPEFAECPECHTDLTDDTCDCLVDLIVYNDMQFAECRNEWESDCENDDQVPETYASYSSDPNREPW